ncbi:MAG: hypothetical protein ABI687_04950 [Flavitalea sp.]
MTKMKYCLFLGLGFAIIVIASCKKDSVKTPVTNTTLISSSTWKYDTAAIDANNDGTMDTAIPSGTIADCEKDNTATFVSGGTGVADEGALKCDDSDPQTTAFTWVFSSDEKMLTFTGPVFSVIDGDVKVLELTSTVLTISKLIEVFPGYSANVIVRLKH